MTKTKHCLTRLDRKGDQNHVQSNIVAMIKTFKYLCKRTYLKKKRWLPLYKSPNPVNLNSSSFHLLHNRCLQIYYELEMKQLNTKLNLIAD